jgi:hypothetical protein
VAAKAIQGRTLSCAPQGFSVPNQGTSRGGPSTSTVDAKFQRLGWPARVTKSHAILGPSATAIADFRRFTQIMLRQPDAHVFARWLRCPLV